MTDSAYHGCTFWVVAPNGETHPTPVSYEELSMLTGSGYIGPVMCTTENIWKTPSDFGVLAARSAPPPIPAVPPAASSEGAPPYHCGYAVIDTETGGFDPRINPLLSVALLAVSPEGDEIDGVALQVRPPPGSVLAVPIPAHMGVDTWKPKIDFCWDLYTGEKLPASALQDRWHITPQAAEINGFVGIGENGFWDFDPAVEWMRESSPVEQVDQALCHFLCRTFQTAPVAVAHNAPFDRKYVARHLPQVFANLACRPVAGKSGNPQWECTMQRLRRYLKFRQLPTGKGTATLEALSKHASFRNDNPHDALADAKACRAGLFWLLGEMRRLGQEP